MHPNIIDKGDRLGMLLGYLTGRGFRSIDSIYKIEEGWDLIEISPGASDLNIAKVVQRGARGPKFSGWYAGVDLSPDCQGVMDYSIVLPRNPSYGIDTEHDPIREGRLFLFEENKHPVLDLVVFELHHAMNIPLAAAAGRYKVDPCHLTG